MFDTASQSWSLAQLSQARCTLAYGYTDTWRCLYRELCWLSWGMQTLFIYIYIACVRVHSVCMCDVCMYVCNTYVCMYISVCVCEYVGVCVCVCMHANVA